MNATADDANTKNDISTFTLLFAIAAPFIAAFVFAVIERVHSLDVEALVQVNPLIGAERRRVASARA